MKWPLLALLLIVSVARAEMDGDAYRGPGAPGDEAERQRVREAIEAERREDAAREAERVTRAQQEKERVARMQARRPYPERLTEMRCGACHSPDALAHIGHSWPGWYLTITRMRVLNGASIAHEETRVLATHLARTQPANRVRALLEYASLLLPLTPGAAWWGWRRWREPGSRRAM